MIEPGRTPPAPTADSAPRNRREWIGALGWPFLVFVAAIASWELVVRTGFVNEIVLPLPEDVATAFIGLLQADYFWQAALVTLQETLLGFMIGAGLGFVLGVCIASVKVIRQALYPYAVAFQNTPRVAFAPVLLTLFGFDIWSKVALAAAICFFPTLLAVMVGIQTVDEDAKTVMRSYGASTWQMFRKLTLPAASPFIFAGLKLGMTFALIGAIVAEFVGAARGMGVLIETFNFQLDVAEAYAVVMALSIMGLALYGIMELLDRKVVFWIDR
jgi:NitT/TauT family transport system permease protein